MVGGDGLMVGGGDGLRGDGGGLVVGDGFLDLGTSPLISISA